MISRQAANAAAVLTAATFLLAAGPLAAQETAAPAAAPAAAGATAAKPADAAAKPADAAAKPADGKAKPPTPVDIVSDQMEILDADKKAIFTGSVDATKGTTNLKADTLTVTYADIKQPDGTTKTDATDLDAKGNVTITTPKETITGDWAKYDPQGEKLVVGGKVKLVQGTTILYGNELHSDLKTNRTQMTGGRVKGSFLPKNNAPAAGTSGTAPKK